MERKQIQVQATQDVLFEQQTGAKVSHDEYGDEDGIMAPIEKVDERKKRPKKTKHVKKDSNVDQGEPEAKVRIEGLSYKVCHLSNFPHLYSDTEHRGLFLVQWYSVRWFLSIVMTYHWRFQTI